MNTQKAAPANLHAVLRRCASCGAVLTAPAETTMLRESAATWAMSATHECALCRLSEYRRSLRDQYTNHGWSSD